jgi:hypothetical protein
MFESNAEEDVGDDSTVEGIEDDGATVAPPGTDPPVQFEHPGTDVGAA